MRLDEALKPSQYRNLVKGWDKEKFKDIFTNPKYKHDKNGYRVFLPITPPKKGNNSIKVPDEIMAILKNGWYEVDDYVKGIAHKRDYPNRKIKIGKLLKNDPEALKKFMNDPQRKATKGEYEIVISRHPYDIAGMATDRGWDSCMNLEKDQGKTYIPLDIKHGTLVAYAVSKGDRDIKNPVARLAIKPFIEVTKDFTLSGFKKQAMEIPKYFGVENRVYGAEPAGFVDTVLEWVDEVNDREALDDVIRLMRNPSLYMDGEEISKIHLKNRDYSNDEELLKLIKKGHSVDFIRQMKNPSEKIQLEVVKRDGTFIRYIDDPSEEVCKTAVTENPYSLEYIDDPSEDIQLAAIASDIFSFEHINNPSEKIQLQAVRQYGLIIRLIPNPSERVQYEAVGENGNALRYIENPTDSVVKRAIRKAPSVVEIIDNPSDEIISEIIHMGENYVSYIKNLPEKFQLKLVKQNPYSISYIRNPSKKIEQLSKELIAADDAEYA